MKSVSLWECYVMCTYVKVRERERGKKREGSVRGCERERGGGKRDGGMEKWTHDREDAVLLGDVGRVGMLLPPGPGRVDERNTVTDRVLSEKGKQGARSAQR